MKKIWPLIILCFGALLLSGCGSTCPADMLTAPVQDSPANWAVVSSLSPTLSWTFTSAGYLYYPYQYAGCIPTKFNVNLSTGPGFSDELGGGVAGSTNTFTPASPLEPGKEYKWGVFASVEAGSGPYGGSRYFFTGPMCKASKLAAPTLLTPADGAIITEANAADTYYGPQPLFTWEYPDPCLPESYRINLSTDPSFTDTSLNGATGNPSTRWMVGDYLEDCTTYYWQVAPVTGTKVGPYSSTFDFYMNLYDDCLTVWPGPWWIVDVDSFCRVGPDVGFGGHLMLEPGQRLELFGRLADLSWFHVRLGEDECWVASMGGHSEGDVEDAPEERDQPTPVPTLVPTATPTEVPFDCGTYDGNLNQCTNDQRCYFDERLKTCRNR